MLNLHSQVCLKCCAAFGFTLDTQTLQSEIQYTFKMNNMTKARSYIVTDFSSVFEPENHAERKVSTLIDI